MSHKKSKRSVQHALCELIQLIRASYGREIECIRCDQRGILRFMRTSSYGAYSVRVYHDKGPRRFIQLLNVRRILGLRAAMRVEKVMKQLRSVSRRTRRKRSKQQPKIILPPIKNSTKGGKLNDR